MRRCIKLIAFHIWEMYNGSSSSERNLVAAAMKSKRHRSQSRTDWLRVCVTVMRWCLRVKAFQTAFWSAASDPCLWVTDYCAWAIQRTWERGGPRSHVLIRDKIRTGFLMFGGRSTEEDSGQVRGPSTRVLMHSAEPGGLGHRPENRSGFVDKYWLAVVTSPCRAEPARSRDRSGPCRTCPASVTSG